MKIKLFLFAFALLSFASVQAQSFYITPHGKHYHRGDCKLVERNSHEIDKYDAKDKGYEPCSICKPDINGSKRGDSSNDGQDKCEPAVQCEGTTKSGNRCKNYTTICGGYCNQHRKN